jgi:hypothetical protein
LSFTTKSATFAAGKIARAIYLSLVYYNKYVKEERVDGMYIHVSMNQVFEVGLEQLFKEDPEQPASLNWFMGTPFNWPVPNIGDTLRLYIAAYFLVV